MVHGTKFQSSGIERATIDFSFGYAASCGIRLFQHSNIVMVMAAVRYLHDVLFLRCVSWDCLKKVYPGA